MHAQLPQVACPGLYQLPVHCCQLAQRQGARQHIHASQLRGGGARPAVAGAVAGGARG